MEKMEVIVGDTRIAKYWWTRSTQKEDNFVGSNVDNAVCSPNMVGGTLHGDDKGDTVLGVSSMCD